ncbi:hypothetical protein C8J57DRAFT_1395515 [Mycena rebaudengoi]|nr:hypothetical protein C8J57DRAFT_1395515 [Mycena rebaudengoi]
MTRSLSLIIFAALLAESYALPSTISRKIRRTEVATTQYHATCGDIATIIKQQMDSTDDTFALLPGRRWPDEFTWSGGFYVTPVKANAVTYGAAFLDHCVTDNRGGVVIIEFGFDASHLAVMPNIQGQPFYDAQGALGNAIRKKLGLGDHEWGDGNAPPDKDEIADMRMDTSSSSVPWSSYDALAPYDVVIGEVPLQPPQQEFMDWAEGFGIAPLQPPFTQVVLVTNTAMGALSWVGAPPLDPDVAQNQQRMLDAQAEAERNGCPPSEDEYEDHDDDVFLNPEVHGSETHSSPSSPISPAPLSSAL